MDGVTVVECEHRFEPSGVLLDIGDQPEFVTFRCEGCGVEIGRPISDDELRLWRAANHDPVADYAIGMEGEY
jgi:hypothetical protein